MKQGASGRSSGVHRYEAAAANRAAVPSCVGTRLTLVHGDAAAIPLRRCDAILCDLPFEVTSRFGYHLDTSRGATLRLWAIQQRIALVWALGSGRVDAGSFFDPGKATATFRGDERLLDDVVSLALQQHARVLAARHAVL